MQNDKDRIKFSIFLAIAIHGTKNIIKREVSHNQTLYLITKQTKGEIEEILADVRELY